MDQNDFDELFQMLLDFKEERNNIQNKIDTNNIIIKKNEYYIGSLIDSEDSGYKVFSPRDQESIHKEDINKAKEDIRLAEDENGILSKDLARYESYIARLNKLFQSKSEYFSKADKKQRNLYALNLQEDDRKRIARDLHDTSLQSLVHLIHKIELSSLFIDQDPMRAKLELLSVQKDLKMTIEEIRNIIFDLRPMTFDDLGLKATFERMIDTINSNKRFEIIQDIEDVSCENSLILISVYHVVKECFSNIIRHAQANKIIFNCKVTNKENMVIHIEDDGIGFTKEELESKQDKHFGISVMQERIHLLGGIIIIDSKKNSGTKIDIEIPLL